MKCKVCRDAAVIDIRRHNANFCEEHFIRYCQQQVLRAIHDYDMLEPDDRVLVAVSGGKDSLAIWDILLDNGWKADGVYVGLGIGTYSDTSLEMTERYARSREVELITVDLRAEHGFDVPTASAETGRVPCSACGISKRHLFDSTAVSRGYDAVITGHNLDDEAAVLFGNVMSWQTDYLGRQRPMLPARDGFPKKAKPLMRLTERETAAYCVLRGIEYQIDECPMAVGNKHLAYKAALNDLDVESPGSKAAFYLGFLQRAVDRFEGDSGRGDLGQCARCGAPTDAAVCAFCRIVQRTEGAAAAPVEVVIKRYAGGRRRP